MRLDCLQHIDLLYAMDQRAKHPVLAVFQSQTRLVLCYCMTYVLHRRLLCRVVRSTWSVQCFSSVYFLDDISYEDFVILVYEHHIHDHPWNNRLIDSLFLQTNAGQGVVSRCDEWMASGKH